jgi:hypothetical protein
VKALEACISEPLSDDREMLEALEEILRSVL